MRPRFLSLPLLALLVLACSDLPTEPTASSSLYATELGLRANVAAHSRAALFAEAVERVARAEGAARLWHETAAIRRHARAARIAGQRADTAELLAAEQAYRQARIEFTASALGDARVDDVDREVRLGVDDARARIAAAQSAGRDVARASALVEQAAARLDGEAATPVAVLEAALDASDALARADQLLLAVNRLPSIDDLFAATLSGIRQDAGSMAARAVLAQYQTLVREAEDALAGTDRERAHDRLQHLRAEQVRIVVERIGAAGVERHMSMVDAAERALRSAPDERRREIVRDYLVHARTALERGDLVRALDRTALAGEIVNALRAEAP